MTTLTKRGHQGRRASSPATPSARKNFFALGLITLDVHPPGRRHDRLDRGAVRPRTRWWRRPTSLAFKAGLQLRRDGRAVRVSPTRSRPRRSTPGTYTNITGNTALAWGLIAAGQLAKLPLFLGQLPDHAGLRHPPRAVEAQELRRAHPAGRGRDRRASAPPSAPPSPATSASPPPAARASTSRPRRSAWPSASSCRCWSSTSSGAARPPGCRPRPSRPTCCWPCTAATASRRCRSSPPRRRPHCFDAAIEAARIALKYRTPVILLSDGYLANGAEPWRLPDVDDAARHLRGLRHRAQRHRRRRQPEFLPYLRDPETLARPWAIPGTPGLEHRIGGIEKEDGTGNITYDPENHERHDADSGRPRSPASPATSRRSRSTTTSGAETARARLGVDLRGASAPPSQRVRARGRKVASAHLVHLNPFPANLGEVLRPLPQGAGARDEPRPAVAAWCAPSTSSTPARYNQGAGPAVHAPPRSRRAILELLDGLSDTTRSARHHQEGLDQRPGGALVPRLRRLLDPRRRADAHARARRAPREHRVRVAASAAPAASRTT